MLVFAQVSSMKTHALGINPALILRREAINLEQTSAWLTAVAAFIAALPVRRR
jgi:hypothetical protein